MSAQHRYVSLMSRVGRMPTVYRNRWFRWAFLTTLARLEHSLGVPDESRAVTLPTGTKLNCDLRDNVQASLYYLRAYSATELALLYRCLAPGDVFLDVGAHVGLFTLEIGRHIGPSGHVVAFEPAADVADQLRSNIELNELSENVDLWQVALGERSGRIALREPSGNAYDVGRRSVVSTERPIAEVALRSFDGLLASGELALERLDGVKIDVEGAEMMVLRGMRNALSTYRPRVVLIETTHTPVDEVHGFMSELDYQALPGNAGDRRRHRHIVNTAFVRSRVSRRRRRQGVAVPGGRLSPGTQC